MPDNSIKPGSIEDLREFLSRFAANETEADEEPTRRLHGEHFHDIRLPCRDLNREILEPGTSDDAPLGAVGIRCDWDFWLVAYLPLRFRNLSCAEIAGCIWPNADRLVFLPDSGDYWWTAKSDESLEVPGESFEVWAKMRYEDERDPEFTRIETFATRAEAVAYAHGRKPQAAISYDILEWRAGTRA